MQRLTILILFAAACGSDSGNKTDAHIDSPSNIDAPAMTLDCASYCTAITANCTAANLQYSDMAHCVASCADFTKGTLTDQGGDTLGCRLNHATLAHSDPTTHCVHAGPSGGGVCGMPCMGFCDIAVAACPAIYANATVCSNACAGFAATPAYTANVTTGNNLSCRIYHAQNATVDPSHCPHISVASTPGTCQ